MEKTERLETELSVLKINYVARKALEHSKNIFDLKDEVVFACKICQNSCLKFVMIL